jgi:hypothetical protein
MHSPATVLLAILAGLAIPAPATHAQDIIATMDIDGGNAFVENVRQPPSGRDVRILDGSLVRTGADTSALVEIIPEGSVQLNENSAKLITNSFFKGTRCFAVRLITGELFINGENVCFLTNVGAVSGISHSRINIKVDERGTVLTVIEGMAELEQAPASMLVHASEQLVVLTNGEYYTNALDPAAAERTAEWTQDYFRAPPEEGMSDGAKAALGIIGAIVIGTVIHEATDDDDDDDRGRGRGDGGSPPARPPRDDAPPLSDSRPPAGQRRPHPVRQPPPEACCVAGTTYRLTPAQCKARRGERGACRIIR